MISLPSGTRICLIAGVADMRKSFNGLGKQGQHVLNYNPFFVPPVYLPRPTGVTLLKYSGLMVCVFSPSAGRKAIYLACGT